MPNLTRMSAEERRAAILEAAMKLFAERGFRGTTTRALAEAVGVTEPVLYEHFKSKRDLYEAIVESKSRESMQRAKRTLEPLAEANDDRALFIGLADFVLSCFEEDQAYERVVLQAALDDPELGALCYEHEREGLQELSDYVARRIRDGVFRPVDPELAVRAFLGIMTKHGTMQMLFGDRFGTGRRQEIIEQFVDIFLRGISK